MTPPRYGGGGGDLSPIRDTPCRCRSATPRRLPSATPCEERHGGPGRNRPAWLEGGRSVDEDEMMRALEDLIERVDALASRYGSLAARIDALELQPASRRSPSASPSRSASAK